MRITQKMPEDNDKPILNYFPPKEENRRHPNPVYVFLLCTPGFLCWTVFLSDVLSSSQLLGEWFVPLWFTAIATAILSLALYIRPKMPWYVWINLAINIPGLLFSLPLIAEFVKH